MTTSARFASTSVMLAATAAVISLGVGDSVPLTPARAGAATHAADTLSIAAADALVQESCVRCHNERRLRGNLSLDAFQVGETVASADVGERMIRKLRAGMMPPAGTRRPDEETLQALATTLETRIDAAAGDRIVPGRRTFQRLNRAEYERAVEDLLALRIDAGGWLPPDTKSANFDNIADVQMLSPTLLQAYLRAAAEVSRLAVGDPDAGPSEATYRVPRWNSQTRRVEGAPWGTRGGVSVTHNFPADGEYAFRVSLHHETTGELYGDGRSALYTDQDPEQIEISIDGERVALLEVGRWMHASDPDGLNLRTDPVFIEGGPRRVTAAFLARYEGPVPDLVSPHEWSIASTSVAGAYGMLTVPHLRDMAITGPFEATGIAETEPRRRIFSCRPEATGPEPGPAAPDERSTEACARQIVERLAETAYRRPVDADDTAPLMSLYRDGAAEGGFEAGVRLALEGILASPHFVFRFEEPPPDAEGDLYRIRDVDLASRLSFFLWARGPDSELRHVAARGELADPDVLERQVRRMLADPRSEALATRFAAQWLRLPDLEKIHPDVRIYPDFDQQLKEDMLEETQRFFHHLVAEDRSALELFTADYTFVNDRLAEHYGIPGVVGPDFRRVAYPDDRRRGLFGQASILTLTSHASTTSPVLRGKWVMEVLLGTPPPPPPPNVPELDATSDVEGGRRLSIRERMEQHRANPSCNSCHRVIDPLGLALDNFDVTGAWRIKDNEVPVDPAGELYDGTPIEGPADLRQALLRRPTPLVRTFIENLMAYALGRRVEWQDMPTVRAIERQAAGEGHRMSAYVLGIVRSPAFQMKSFAETEDGQE